jgi:hypothetical protein
MVRRRLLYSSGETSFSIAALWHRLCVPLIDGQDSLDYLVSRSLVRPRYLLRLINYCKGNAINFHRESRSLSARVRCFAQRRQRPTSRCWCSG